MHRKVNFASQWREEILFAQILSCKFLVRQMVIISRTELARAIIGLSLFFTIQKIWIVLGRCLFLRSVHTFHDFWCQIGVVILVTPKQMERKSEWFCGSNSFCSYLKLKWENGVWTKVRFLAGDFLFTCGNFTLMFTVFRFFGSVFFLNGFPNPFIVHSLPGFFLFETNFRFSLVVFCF